MVMAVALPPVQAELHRRVEFTLAAEGESGLAALRGAEVLFGHLEYCVGADLHCDVVRDASGLEKALRHVYCLRPRLVASHVACTGKKTKKKKKNSNK